MFLHLSVGDFIAWLLALQVSGAGRGGL